MEKDWVFGHLALHVKDLDEIAGYYESIGIGIHLPIKPGAPPPPDAKVPETLNLRFGKAVGKAVGATPADASTFLTFSQIGTLNVEHTKISPSSSNWASFERKGENIHHMCFNVPDLHAESTPLIMEKGCEVPFVYINSSLIQENHIDTSKFGGVILSLRPDPDGKRSAREKAARERLPISDWNFRGIGIAVADMDKLVEYYQFLGMGTFQPEAIFDSDTIADFKVNGKPSETAVKARTRIAQVGPVTYEFTQPLEGDTIYKESLDKRGDGVNDFIFTVDDLDKETAKLVEKGVSVIRSGNPRNGGAFAQFDTRKVGNIMMKLIQA